MQITCIRSCTNTILVFSLVMFAASGYTYQRTEDAAVQANDAREPIEEEGITDTMKNALSSMCQKFADASEAALSEEGILDTIKDMGKKAVNAICSKVSGE